MNGGPRWVVVALVTGVSALLGGCEITVGDEQQTRTVTDPATTVTEREVDRTRTRESTPPEPVGPTGALGTSSVGPVEVGMEGGDVEDVFGPPDRKEPVNFRGPRGTSGGWIWEFDDGDFRLQFETGAETVTGYVSETAELATRSGITIGDSFEPIRNEYGDELEESVIGEEIYVLSEGAPGTYPALSFALAGDEITSISGGEPQAAGE